MTAVGIIGSGAVGGAVARLAIGAGHRVILSNSRGPATLGDLVAELGPSASASTSAGAAVHSDLVVIAVPVKAWPGLPSAELAGETVVDATNYGPERDGQIPELDAGSLTSSALLGRRLAGARVVKALNTIYYEHLRALARPRAAADRSSLPIAGDVESAKATVAAFVDSLGFGVVDAGTLADSWRQQTGAPVWGAPYGPASSSSGRPAGDAAIRAALAAARR